MAAVLKEIPILEYHRSPGLSKSMISVLDDCPTRFKYQYLDGGKKEETASLRLGNAMHVLALEPELWKSGYHVLPEGHRKDARTEKHKEQVDIAAGRTMLKQEEFETVEGMADALVKNPFALSLLKAPGRVEASIFWEFDGINMRCRPDFMRNDGLIVDLKTARSVKPEFFFKDAYNYHYDLSVALTTMGYEELYGKIPDNYIFLCIESEPPYLIEAYESYRSPVDGDGMPLGPSYLDKGRERLDKLISIYKGCVLSGVWPGYVGKIRAMEVPRWAI